MTPDEVKQVNAGISALIQFLVSWASGFIPVLGTVLHLPVIGWIANLIINWLTNSLITRVDNFIKDKKVDSSVKTDVDAAENAKKALNASSPKDADHGKKVDELVAATNKLRHIDVVQP